MARSERYIRLERNLRELRRHLLPARFSPTGSYSDRVLTKTIAFRVLVHAEVESYLEECAWDRARRALIAWKNNSQVTKTTLGLLAFCGFVQEGPPKALVPDQPSEAKLWPGKLEIGEKLKRAGTAYHRVVETNHGIREANLLSLLLPIAVDPKDLDPFWVATLDSFGERRGEAAHTSVVQYRTRQPPDPETELRDVEGILRWLKSVDKLLASYE